MTLWRGKYPLILASQSGARQTLLASAGIAFEAMPADIDERAVQQSSGLATPGDIAALLAREKARGLGPTARPIRHRRGSDAGAGAAAVQQTRRPCPGREQLRALAGSDHELHSAVAVARDGKSCSKRFHGAMTMRPLTEAEIEAYLDEAGEAVTTSVGAYQLEGLGVHLFERIEGDHFTILGLPLLPLLAFLRSERLLAV